jgi:hypothetical protein
VAGLARRWGWTRPLDGTIVWCDFWL